MLNSRHQSAGFMQSRWHYALVTLGLFFGCLTLISTAQAQEGANDPVTGVEVTIGDPSGSGSGSVQSNAVTVTNSHFVYRDAVATVSGKVHCYDDEGDATPHATVSSVTMSGPGTVSPTSGTTDQNGDLAITIKSTDISPDDATGTVTATSNSVNGSGSVSFKGALQIKNGNTDVTHAPTNSMIGEQQSLVVSLRSGVSISSATWTFGGGGTPILNWQQSDPNNTSASLTTPIPSSGLTGTSAKFYVTTVGTAAVSVSVTDSGGTGTGTTNVNISEPSFTFTATEQPPAADNDTLSLGTYFTGANSGTKGIVFTGSGGTGGSLSNAQIVYSDDASITFSNGTTGENSTNHKNDPGLDEAYPYGNGGNPNAASGSTSDSPHFPDANYVSKTTTDIKYNSFDAIMYLMWTSSKPSSIPIRVESIHWSFSAEATFNTSTGHGNIISKTPTAAETLSGTACNSGVLNWTKVWAP